MRLDLRARKVSTSGAVSGTIAVMSDDDALVFEDDVNLSKASARDKLAQEIADRAGVSVERATKALLALLDDVQKSVKVEAPKEQRTRPPASALPSIKVNARYMHEITAEALTALQAGDSDRQSLYVRGGIPVRLLSDDDDGLHVQVLNLDILKGLLDRTAGYVSIQNDHETPSRPPDDVVRDILSLDDLPFRKLTGIYSAPVMLPDGSILNTSGYDAASGYVVDLNGLSGVDTSMSVGDAVDLLMGDLFGDFLFADQGSKAHALAMTIQPLVMPLIGSPCPLYLVDASTRGTGKGLLVEVALSLNLGRSVGVMSQPRDEDEMRKHILSFLVAGNAVIFLDNVTRLASGILSNALTAPFIEGRVLGSLKVVRVPNKTTWVASGNNVELSDEILRRTIPIRLTADMERPEDRTGFKHENLTIWAQTNRKLLVGACLSLASAWARAGMPNGDYTLGRYERWAQVMGGILDVAGVPGFLSNREELYMRADERTQEWTLFCEEWWETYGERSVTAKDLLEIAKESGLLLDIWGSRSSLAGQQRFGHALRIQRDRVYGRYRIQSVGRDGQTRNLAYRLQNTLAGESLPEQTPETPETNGPF